MKQLRVISVRKLRCLTPSCPTRSCRKLKAAGLTAQALWHQSYIAAAKQSIANYCIISMDARPATWVYASGIYNVLPHLQYHLCLYILNLCASAAASGLGSKALIAFSVSIPPGRVTTRRVPFNVLKLQSRPPSNNLKH